MLLVVLVGGGAPLYHTGCSEAARVAEAVRALPVPGEGAGGVEAHHGTASAAAQGAHRSGHRARPPGGIPAGIPDVGAWADRAGVPVSAATPRARVSSGFGLRVHPVWGGVRAHAGVDFAVPHGTPVTATASGVVVAAGWSGGYGLRVDVRHPASGLTTRYAHLERVARGVRAGVPVRRGALVGFAGSSGVATGPHLHYEVRDASGAALDPAALARRYQAGWARALREYRAR